MQHRFAVGDRVAYTHPGPWRFGRDDVYIVIRQLPKETDGEPAYQIKHAAEPHLRCARESDLVATTQPPEPVRQGSRRVRYRDPSVAP